MYLSQSTQVNKAKAKALKIFMVTILFMLGIFYYYMNEKMKKQSHVMIKSHLRTETTAKIAKRGPFSTSHPLAAKQLSKRNPFPRTRPIKAL